MVEVEVGGLVLGRRIAFSCTVYETRYTPTNHQPWRWEIRPADGLTWEQVLGPDWKEVTQQKDPGPVGGTRKTEKEARDRAQDEAEFLVRTVLGENRFRWVVTAEPGEPEPEPELLNNKKRRRRRG